MPVPYQFYTGEGTEYQCPNGHTIESSRSEKIPWLRAFRGRCSCCEDAWAEFVDEHADDWAVILDENFPENPTFFEWNAQRITDWNRCTNVSVADRAPEDRKTPPELPRTDDFSGSVPWVAVDAPSALRGLRVGFDHDRSDGEGDASSDSSSGDEPWKSAPANVLRWFIQNPSFGSFSQREGYTNEFPRRHQ